MKCPKCGFPHEGNTSICPNCATPLSNADFSPAKEKPKRTGLIVLLILMLLILAGTGGFFGYRFYLKKVESECLKTTEKVMECAKNMDFSPLGQENLPEELADQANIREQIPGYIDAALQKEGLTEIVEMLGIEKDYDQIADIILSNADYSIDKVETTYNKCTITLTTNNINYPVAITNMQSELTSIIDNANVTDWGWWSSLKDWVSQLFSGEDKFPTNISGWLDKVITNEEPQARTGQIVYGIKDRQWTVLSFDQELIYNYYGFPQEEVTE